MKRTLVLVLATALATAGAAAQSKAPEPKSQGSFSADQVIAGWKATPQEVAKKMLAKYGEPQEITTSRLI